MDPEFARQYYESATADHWWFEGRRHLTEVLLDRLAVKTGTYLDLGAGSESMLPPTLSLIKADIVRPEGVVGLFVQASATSLPFGTASLDGVGLFDLLEHLEDPRSCLAETKRVLRPEGVIIITVPAHRWLWSPHDDLVGHRHRYSVSELQSLLRCAGFRVEWWSTFYGFLIPVAMIRAVLRLHSPMARPPETINRWLTAIARRSASKSLDRSRRLGLSIAAVATVA